MSCGVSATEPGNLQAELGAILQHGSLMQAGILILANKQDLRDAMSVEELSTALGLTSVRDHPWHMQPSCAVSGTGLQEGLAWIADRVQKS